MAHSDWLSERISCTARSEKPYLTRAQLMAFHERNRLAMFGRCWISWSGIPNNLEESASYPAKSSLWKENVRSKLPVDKSVSLQRMNWSWIVKLCKVRRVALDLLLHPNLGIGESVSGWHWGFFFFQGLSFHVWTANDGNKSVSILQSCREPSVSFGDKWRSCLLSIRACTYKWVAHGPWGREE